MFDFIEDTTLREKVIEAYNSGVKEAVDKEVNGLKSKNAQLLDESKKNKQELDNFKSQFGEIDPVEAINSYKLVNSEEGKLLKEGKKLEDLVQLATSNMKSDFETKLAEANNNSKKFQESSTTWENKYRNKIVEDTLREAALQAGILPTAIPDLIARGSNVFKMNDDGDVEARDSKGNLLKVGELIATPKNWVDSLKTVAPHYWGKSEGADFTGTGGRGGNDLEAKMLDAAKRKDMAAYRKYKAQLDKQKTGKE